MNEGRKKKRKDGKNKIRKGKGLSRMAGLSFQDMLYHLSLCLKITHNTVLYLKS